MQCYAILLELLMLRWAAKLFIKLKDKNTEYIFFSPLCRFLMFCHVLKILPHAFFFVLFCLFVCFLICVGTVSVLCTEISQPQKSSASTFSSVFWFIDRKWRRVTLHSTHSFRKKSRTLRLVVLRKGSETKTSTTGGFLLYRWGHKYSKFLQY